MAKHEQTGEPSVLDGGAAHYDELFDVLSHSHRRFVLRSLLAGDPPVSVASLSTDLADWTARRPTVDGGSSDPAALERSLVHSHLPILTDTDFVTHDAAARTVAPAERVDEVQPYLRAMANEQ